MVVLIVDDAKIMRTILGDIFERFYGVDSEDIHEAEGGLEAVEKFKRIKPDLVLLDIRMPDMDGVETIREIMKVDADAKVIMCTAQSERENVRECIKLGAKDYITKPPEPDRVLEAIDKIMGTNTADTDTDADAGAAD